MKILFQGDSITDALRDRSDCHDMGQGYAKFASAMIADAFPDIEFEFVNLGIGGNRTDQLLARTTEDIINIQPDIVSILIGVNDVWHRYLHHENAQNTDEQYEANYRTILERIRKETNAKIMMIEPFMIGAPDKEHMRDEINHVIAIANRLADEYADAFLPMAQIFAESLKTAPATVCYSLDGVHPEPDGACLIAQHYLSTVSPLIEGLDQK